MGPYLETSFDTRLTPFDLVAVSVSTLYIHGRLTSASILFFVYFLFFLPAPRPLL